MRQWDGQRCQRCFEWTLEDCYKTSTGFIMSMYNEQMICAPCKDRETKRDDYRAAADADDAAIRQGNFNFRGIGLK